MTDKPKRASIPQNVRFNVLRRDNFTCRYCGKGSPEVTLHLDHVIPHSKGGEDNEANLVTACERCNFGKGASVDVVPPVQRPAEQSTGGLVGMFGHTYVPSETGPNLKYQFFVIRRVSETRFAVQLFSWIDGSPTEVEVWTEDYLCGSDVKLYATKEDWLYAYEKYDRARSWRDR